MSWIKVWRDLSAKKMRTLLVVLSIAVGVMAISMVFGAKAVLLPRMDAAYLATNPIDIRISVEGVSAEIVEQLAEHPDIKLAEGAFKKTIRWRADGRWNRLLVEGSSDILSRQIRTVELVEGGAPAQGEFLFEHLVTDAADVSVGDEVEILTDNGEYTAKIAGYVYDLNQGSPKMSGSVKAYFNLESAEHFFGHSNYTHIYLKVYDETRLDSIADELEQLLVEQYDVEVWNVNLREIGVNPNSEQVEAMLAIMGGIGTLALLLSGFLVVNTVSTVLASEVPHIGTMKALGGTRWMVVRVYLMLVLGYGIVGSIVGLVLGIVGLNVLTKFIASLINTRLTGFVVPPIALALGLLVGIVIPLLAAFVPVWRATGVTVREAMASYGLDSKTGRIEQLLTRITNLPFTVTLPLRNLFRSKGRTLLTLIALTLAGVSFVSVQATSSSLSKMLDILFMTSDADITVYTRDGTIDRSEFMAVLDDVEGIDAAEIRLVRTDSAHSPSLKLRGIPIDTTIFTYQDVLLEGRWFKADDNNTLIVSDIVARKYDYAVGDQITTEVNDGHQSWEIIGIVNDFRNNGRQLFTSYTQMTTLLDTPNVATSLVIRLQNRETAKVDALDDFLAKELPKRDMQVGTYITYKDEEQSRSNTRLLVLFLVVMIVLVTAVGALGLLGTLTINVTERIKEIGVMRSIGASNRTIVQIFWLEGLFLGVISWVLAALIGYPVARNFTDIISTTMRVPMEFSMPPSTLMLLGIGILIVTTVSAIFPALGAARKRVADIIRYA